MAYTKASNKAVQRYSKAHYDSMIIRVTKGDAEKIKAHAQAQGLSLNAYVNKLIFDDMSKEQKPSENK